LLGAQCKGAYFDRIYPEQRNIGERLHAAIKKLKVESHLKGPLLASEGFTSLWYVGSRDHEQ
jgi:hypothetical protein